MKNLKYFTVLYAGFVFLGGIMAFWHANQLPALFEILASILLFIACFFFKKEKNFIYLITFILIFLLTVFYGYRFAATTNFYPGILAAISAFFTFAYGYQIFKSYSQK